MIYLTTNTDCYSLNIKKEFLLKKDNSQNNMEIFSNEQITLIDKKNFFYKNIISLSEFLAKKDIKENDIFIDLDYEKAEKNEIFIINKISYDNRMYIFDILYKHSFNEASIKINGEKSEDIVIQNTKEEINWKDKMIPYTSNGTFEVANHFFKTYQIIFSRILFNDDLKLMKMLENFLNFALEVDDMYKGHVSDKKKMTAGDLRQAKAFSEKLKFSITMEIEFINLLKYYKILNNNLDDLFEKITENIKNEKNIDKKRGKILFEYIKKIIME